MKAGAKKVPKWESDLWGYLSSGDGMQCPTYNRCQKRLKGGWCPSDNLDRIACLLDDRQFKISKYPFIGSTGDAQFCGRVFRLVERLAEKYLKRAGVHCLPVPAEMVSLADEQHPVEIRPVALRTCHGAIWHLKDGWVIQLKASDTSRKKRFALFHEVFHVLAHRRASPVFRKGDYETGAFNELLADYFAGCILMPRKWVEEKWSEVKDLSRMAEIFDVEKSLMWIRLRELGLT